MTHPEKPPQSPLQPVNFRFPKELRDQLQQAAKANQRSMSGEVIYRLSRSLNPPKETSHV